MTGSAPEMDGDLVALTISGRIAHFPGRAGERVRSLADPDKAAPSRPDARTYRVRLVHASQSRQLTVPEPFTTPELAQLVRAVRNCL